jgi:gluconolactonase
LHPTLGLLTSGGGDIVRRDLGGRVSVYRKGAGSNDLKFDREKSLVICEASSRRVTRLEDDGHLTILAERFDGHRFNQPTT